jgi:PAS domain S-box-containing protein
MDAGLPFSFEYRIMRSDGTIRNVWEHGYPVPSTSERVKYYVGVAQDITEKRLTEEALKESKEYLNQILNCLGDPIFVKDREHRFALVNDALCTFAGLPREQLLGRIDRPDSVNMPFWEQEEDVFKTGGKILSEDAITDIRRTPHTVMTKKPCSRIKMATNR